MKNVFTTTLLILGLGADKQARAKLAELLEGAAAMIKDEESAK